MADLSKDTNGLSAAGGSRIGGGGGESEGRGAAACSLILFVPPCSFAVTSHAHELAPSAASGATHAVHS